MERQQAFTVLGAAGAAAAATASLLFLWLPADPPRAPLPGPDDVAALRREVALLKDELAARPAPLPAPVVAERVVEIEDGRARDELVRRCDELVARCDEFERTVAELEGRLAKGAMNATERMLFLPLVRTEARDSVFQRFDSIGSGKYEVRLGFYRGSETADANGIELQPPPVLVPDDQ